MDDIFHLSGSMYYLLGILSAFIGMALKFRHYIPVYFGLNEFNRTDNDIRLIVFTKFVPLFTNAPSVEARKFQDEITTVILRKKNISYFEFVSIGKNHNLDENYVKWLLDEISKYGVFDIQNDTYSRTKDGEKIFKNVRFLIDVALVDKVTFFEKKKV